MPRQHVSHLMAAVTGRCIGIRWRRLAVGGRPAPRSHPKLNAMPTPILLGFVLVAMCLQVLLLPLFHGPTTCCGPVPLPALPRFYNGLPVRDGPMVHLFRDSLLIDGVEVAWPSAQSHSKAEAGSAPLLVAFELLSRKRSLWNSFHPREPFPGRVVLFVDRDLRVGRVKDFARICAETGYRSMDFVGVNMPK